MSSAAAPLTGRPSTWRAPKDHTTAWRLPATFKCNSMVVSPAGLAKRGNDRTAAQKEAAARNLLHQTSTAAPGADGDKDAAACSTAAPGRNGYMSKATRSKAKTLIDNMIFIAELAESKRQTMNEALGYKQQACYLTFVTLTLPSAQLLDSAGEYDDEHAKRHLLRPMIERLKHKFGVKAFIWVSEPQENGNIHFHLLIDKYINNTKNSGKESESQLLTKAWNSILSKHGYIDAYASAQRARHAKGFAYDSNQHQLVESFDEATGRYITTAQEVSYVDQVEAYAYGEATSWQNPNTVDIHRLQSQNNIKGYICKYMTKNDGTDTSRRKISGNLWGAADVLRDIKAYKEEFSDEIRAALMQMSAAVPNSLRVSLVTSIGTISLQEYEDSDMAGQVPVLATLYTYSQKLFWRFAPAAFKQRFTDYYRDAFRRIYTPGRAAPLPARLSAGERVSAPVAALCPA
jgi:hypothetical protein